MATAAPPKSAYPRPPLQLEDLFREPVYADGQPYAIDSEDEEDK